jgi:hypothetical protein
MKALQAFLQVLDELPAWRQEQVLLEAAEMVRKERKRGRPCPCESGKMFRECHGKEESCTATSQERVGSPSSGSRRR